MASPYTAIPIGDAVLVVDRQFTRRGCVPSHVAVLQYAVLQYAIRMILHSNHLEILGANYYHVSGLAMGGS